MTALAGYDRLECEGRYRAEPDAPVASVLVKFGDASLMIMTFADEPITHWPLASLAAAGRAAGEPLRLQPDATAPDRLEIDDPAMIAAITEVCRSLNERPARRRLGRRWRWPLRLAALAALLAAGVAATPPALERFATLIPEPARARLGSAALRRLAGANLCETPAGTAALARLARQLSAGDGAAVGLLVAALPEGAPPAIGAPGRQVLIDSRTVAAASGPAALAAPVALALAEAGAARHTAYALSHAGLAVMPALLSGTMDHPALVAAAAQALARPRPSGEAVAAEALALRAAMPIDSLPRPLAVSDWRAIRALCQP